MAEKEPPKENEPGENYVDYGDILASWEFPEHIRHERGLKWYVFFFTILALIIIVSITGLNFTFFRMAGQPFSLNLDGGNYLFVIMIVLFLILYFYY